MALSETLKGTPTIDNTVNDLFASQTIRQHYATWIFFNNLTLGDSFEITIFVNDSNTPAEIIYDQFIVTDAQPTPGVFIPFVPTDSYRVTAQKLTGTDRVLDFVLYTSN